MRNVLAFSVWAIACEPALAVCPVVDENDPRRADLLDQVRLAPNEGAAQLITNQLWEIWATAPDAHAQELLDEGLQRRRVGDLEGAYAAFDALVAYCPVYAEGYNQRAFVAFIRQDYDQALTDLNRAIDLAPDHFAAIAGRALTEIGLGRNDVAQDTLKQALRLNPWLPERRFLSKDATPGTEL